MWVFFTNKKLELGYCEKMFQLNLTFRNVLNFIMPLIYFLLIFLTSSTYSKGTGSNSSRSHPTVLVTQNLEKSTGNASDQSPLAKNSISDRSKESEDNQDQGSSRGGLLLSFMEFQKGASFSRNEIDISELLLGIVDLASGLTGNKILPSLELLDFFQKVIEYSKYDTVTTLDFIQVFVSRDSFDTNIFHDLAKLKTFSEYLSYLIRFKYPPGTINKHRLDKESLLKIKTRIHSAIWEMEELIKVDRILDYENQNNIGTTVYCSQPLITEINNDLFTNLPRPVFSYKFTKNAILKVVGTNINKLNDKLGRISGKFLLSKEFGSKVFSPNLIYSIYLSILILNDLYNEGLSSNILSPGFIFLVLLRSDIDNLPEKWEEKLIENHLEFGINESEVVEKSKYSHGTIIGGSVQDNNLCHRSAFRIAIQDIFKKYGIEFFGFTNEILKGYKSSFQPPGNRYQYGYFAPNKYYSSGREGGSINLRKTWYSDITQYVIENEFAKAADLIDEYNLLEISLSRVDISSAILVGKSDILKRILVENLAYFISIGKSSNELRGYRVLSINIDSLLEACSNSRNIVKRIGSKIDELIATYDGKVIFFIEENHLFSDFETSSGTTNLYNILKPAILTAELKVIGTVSSENYEKLVERNKEIEKFMEKIKIKELSGIVTQILISGLRHHLELSSGIFINTDVINLSVVICSKYVEGCIFPDDVIELINSAISMAKGEQFSEFPSDIQGAETFIHYSKIGLKISKMRDYESSHSVNSNREWLVRSLKMHLKLRNRELSVSTKLKPYLDKFRYLKTQLYYFTLIFLDHPVSCSSGSEEDERKIIIERERIIPNFSDEMSVKQLTGIYRKNLMEYKQTNNKFDDEAINEYICTVTKSQLDPNFFENIHPLIRERQKELADMKSLILEMAFNYFYPYSPLGMGEIDASHIAYIVSNKYRKSVRDMLDEIEFRKLPENMKARISEVLKKYVIGQEHAIDYISNQLGSDLYRSQRNVPDCFLFVGPPGTGKRMFARTLNLALRESQIFLYYLSNDATKYFYSKEFNASDLLDMDSVRRLMGDESVKGIIPESIERSSETIFLFYNIERMHPQIIEILTFIVQNKNNFNLKHKLLGAKFLFTTELGSEVILNNPDKINADEIRSRVVGKLKENINPNLINGIRNIALFRPYTKDEVVRILEINFSEFSLHLKKKYNVTFLSPSLSVLNEIVERNYSPRQGSRTIIEYIDRNVKDKIKYLIKKGTLKPFTTFKMSIRKESSPESGSGELQFEFILLSNTK
ncbi:ATP-dependent Clp proteinase ATP-binding chain [Cryptosporidium felis]|nr:ATP-dependent Clp proteinase ATP-binding chain [Cryptosporidium felis]